jgi:hypothetical protein
MSLKKVRLALARDHDFPRGSRRHGYDLVAPLDSDNRLDPELWKKERKHCRVRRFWGDEEDELGHLVRKPGGHWAFHYDIEGDADDDEAGYRFNDERFVPGEYVSIHEQDDTMRTFQVITVDEVNFDK